MSANRKLWEAKTYYNELVLESNGLYAYVDLDDLAEYWKGGAWRKPEKVGALLVPTALMEWNND